MNVVAVRSVLARPNQTGFGSTRHDSYMPYAMQEAFVVKGARIKTGLKRSIEKHSDIDLKILDDMKGFDFETEAKKTGAIGIGVICGSYSPAGLCTNYRFENSRFPVTNIGCDHLQMVVWPKMLEGEIDIPAGKKPQLFKVDVNLYPKGTKSHTVFATDTTLRYTNAKKEAYVVPPENQWYDVTDNVTDLTKISEVRQKYLVWMFNNLDDKSKVGYRSWPALYRHTMTEDEFLKSLRDAKPK